MWISKTAYIESGRLNYIESCLKEKKLFDCLSWVQNSSKQYELEVDISDCSEEDEPLLTLINEHHLTLKESKELIKNKVDTVTFY